MDCEGRRQGVLAQLSHRKFF